MQIAAALWMKGRQTCAQARPEQLNLVASNLRLASLPDDDPALVELRRAVAAETGIPSELTDEIVHALRGADHLGSLLKIDAAVEDAIRRHEAQVGIAGDATQTWLIDDVAPRQQTLAFPKEQMKASVLDRLEVFLSRHTSGDDLGLRLRGEQLTAGVRFLRLVREGTYDLVVGNPPYQGTGKLFSPDQFVASYKDSHMDLFAGFFAQGISLIRRSGVVAFITLSNWMFLTVFRPLRKLIRANSIATIADIGKAGFSTGGTLISTACAVVRKSVGDTFDSVAVRANESFEVIRDEFQPIRAQAGLLRQSTRFVFQTKRFDAVLGEPILY